MTRVQPQYRVTKSVKTRILNSLPVKLLESPQLAKNQYIQKILLNQEILCCQCYRVLQIGEHYNRNQKTNRRMVYYFCLDCDKKRYH